MSRLLLVRHGETELNSAERYWGYSDVKLGALGFSQAERLRDRLAKEKIDTIYSSDLQRALVTAKTIASRHHLDVISCKELREINFGKVEGLNLEEVAERFPEFAAEWRGTKSIDLKFPGGESVTELGNRVSGFLDRLQKHTGEETVLVVAHAGVIRTLICQLIGMELRYLYHIHVDLGSLSIVQTYPTEAILCRLNDVSHLDNI